VKQLTYTINLLASIAVFIVGIQSMDTFSLGGIGFLLWAISPYLYASFMMKRSIDGRAIKILFVLSLILTIGGIYLLLDAMYIHPDPQGALAFVVIPIYQWFVLLVALVLMYVGNKYGNNIKN